MVGYTAQNMGRKDIFISSLAFRYEIYKFPCILGHSSRL